MLADFQNSCNSVHNGPPNLEPLERGVLNLEPIDLNLRHRELARAQPDAVSLGPPR